MQIVAYHILSKHTAAGEELRLWLKQRFSDGAELFLTPEWSLLAIISHHHQVS